MFQNYHGDKVIVHCPITFHERSEVHDEVDSARDSASKTYASITCDEDWKRFTENDFKLKKEDTEDQVVLLYNKPPPVILKSKENELTSGCNANEASCLEGCNENEASCLEGCNANEAPCLESYNENEAPCLEGCNENEAPCLEGCNENEAPCLEGCNENEAPCLESYNESKTTSKQEVVSWCRSSYLKHTTKNHLHHDCSSPTDHLRYKTCIRITGCADDWISVWDNLCKSLQSGKYEYCNAYLNDGEEICIYHYGWQNIIIGEWIWKNIKCEYEKSSTVVLAS